MLFVALFGSKSIFLFWLVFLFFFVLFVSAIFIVVVVYFSLPKEGKTYIVCAVPTTLFFS